MLILFSVTAGTRGQESVICVHIWLPICPLLMFLSSVKQTRVLFLSSCPVWSRGWSSSCSRLTQLWEVLLRTILLFPSPQHFIMCVYPVQCNVTQKGATESFQWSFQWKLSITLWQCIANEFPQDKSKRGRLCGMPVCQLLGQSPLQTHLYVKLNNTLYTQHWNVLQ